MNFLTILVVRKIIALYKHLSSLNIVLILLVQSTQDQMQNIHHIQVNKDKIVLYLLKESNQIVKTVLEVLLRNRSNLVKTKGAFSFQQ